MFQISEFCFSLHCFLPCLKRVAFGVSSLVFHSGFSIFFGLPTPSCSLSLCVCLLGSPLATCLLSFSAFFSSSFLASPSFTLGAPVVPDAARLVNPLRLSLPLPLGPSPRPLVRHPRPSHERQRRIQRRRRRRPLCPRPRVGGAGRAVGRRGQGQAGRPAGGEGGPRRQVPGEDGRDHCSRTRGFYCFSQNSKCIYFMPPLLSC